MDKNTIFPLFVTLLFMRWMTIVESAHTSEAKFISATQRKDNPYMVVVENEDVRSGWAIDVKTDLTKAFTDGQIYVLFYIRTTPKAELEEAFHSSLCFLVINDDEYNNFLPKQIGSMLFPKQKGSCDFTESEHAIRATAQVNTDVDDNKGLFLKPPPYELEVRVVGFMHNSTRDIDDSDYFFKVNFSVGGDIKKK